MHCPYCGNVIEDDSIFCPFCGKKLPEPTLEPSKSKINPSTINSQVPPQSAPSSSISMAPPPSYSPQVENNIKYQQMYPGSTSQKKPWPITFSKIMFFIAGLLSLLVTLSSYYLYTLIRNNQNVNTNPLGHYNYSSTIFIYLVFIYLFTTIFYFLVFYGLVKEKTWARALSIIGYILIIFTLTLSYLNIIIGIIGIYGMGFDKKTKEYFYNLSNKNLSAEGETIGAVNPP